MDAAGIGAARAAHPSDQPTAGCSSDSSTDFLVEEKGTKTTGLSDDDNNDDDKSESSDGKIGRPKVRCRYFDAAS